MSEHAHGPEPVDPLDLIVAARRRRKSWGGLSRVVAQSLPLVWAAGRFLFLVLVSLQVLTAFAMAGQVFAVQSVLDAVLRLDEPGGSVAHLWSPVLLFAGLTMLAAVSAAVQRQVQRLLGERVARAMWVQVLDVATSVDLRHFETPEFYNRLERVQTNAITRPYQVSEGLFAMGGAMAAGVGLGAALVSIHPLLLPLVVLAGLPVLVTSRRESRLEFDFAVAQTPVLRQIDYLTTLQTGRDEAKEIRAFALRDWLRERFDRYYSDYLKSLTTHLRRRAALSVLGNIGSAAILVTTLAVLVWLIVMGEVSVAGAGAAIIAIRMLSGQVQATFGGVQRLFESGLFLDDLETFLQLDRSLPPRPGGSAPARFDEILVDEVSFTYPGSEAAAVSRASIRLRDGEVVALVGENGSGKTTLAKLVAGLYEPQTGAVRWDGTDIRSFRPESLRERITVVFQDFIRYAFTAEENISLAPVTRARDRHRVRDAAVAAGADEALSRLPAGYATVLSRLFAGGRDLSGGQWQRVAVARAFHRAAPLIILDEPSASLDPRAEHELFTKLREVLSGRTTLFVSHRLATVRGADRIYLLHGGTVLEQGTHEELLALGGHYAELYHLQRDAFVAQERTGGTGTAR